MTADAPTILATSGGFTSGERRFLRPGPFFDLCFALAGTPQSPSGSPRLTYIGTALGDQLHQNARVHEAFYGTDVLVTCLNLLPMPNLDDLRGHLLSQDVVWVHGGSVAGLLALWELHGLGAVLRECWRAGVVLAGVSAGSLCWHVGGTTDSFGPELRPVTNGLALVPYGNGVHYDSEARRRPLLHQLVGDGTLPLSYATDDGVGLLYRGTELVEAVAETPGKGAYRVERQPDGTVLETRIEPRLL